MVEHHRCGWNPATREFTNKVVSGPVSACPGSAKTIGGRSSSFTVTASGGPGISPPFPRGSLGVDPQPATGAIWETSAGGTSDSHDPTISATSSAERSSQIRRFGISLAGR
jgi:hypothetical protein